MKRLALALVIGFAIGYCGMAIANAQPAPVPQNYTLQVTSAELGVIGQALGALPFKDVAALIRKLDEQYTAQNIAAQKAQEAPPPEKQ